MTQGKHILLDLLRMNGVRFVFGNPGSTELPLMDAFVVEREIRYILGLNEVVVMGMADGYAQATGELAVVNLHAAPGLGNAMGMLYNAAKAGAPVLVTAGQQDTTIALTEPLLWDDLARLARPLCKWSYEVTRLEDLPRAVHRAAKVACTHPTGPVFLSVPGDVLTASADLDLMAPTRVGPRLRGDAGEIAKAAALIGASTTPVIFAGDAVPRSDAFAELAALAEAIGAPVYLEGMANTAAFPSDHPLYGGSVARMAPALRALMERHDLAISIGADMLTQSLSSGVEALAPATPLIHLDTDPWEIGKNFPAVAAIQGDPKATLPELTAQLTAQPERRARVEAMLAEKRVALVAQAEAEAAHLPLRPLAVLNAIGALLPRRRDRHRGNAVERHEQRPPADARDAPRQLVRHARRRHRGCDAAGDRDQARAPDPPGGRTDRRRQRDVRGRRALDDGALPAEHRDGGAEQPFVPHPQAAHPRARRAQRGARRLCRDGLHRSADRFHGAGRGTWGRRRPRGDAARSARGARPRAHSRRPAADRGGDRRGGLSPSLEREGSSAS